MSGPAVWAVVGVVSFGAGAVLMLTSLSLDSTGNAVAWVLLIASVGICLGALATHRQNRTERRLRSEFFDNERS